LVDCSVGSREIVCEIALPRWSGDNLTRENIMRQAANLKDFRTEVLLPRVMINTSPSDFAPISLTESDCRGLCLEESYI